MSNSVLKKKAQADILQQVIFTAFTLIILLAFVVGYLNEPREELSLQHLVHQQSNRVLMLGEFRCEELNCLEKEKLRMLDEEYLTILGRSKITVSILHETTIESVVLYDALSTGRDYQRLQRFVQVKEEERIMPAVLLVEMRR